MTKIKSYQLQSPGIYTTYFHEQIDGFCKGRDCLFRFLLGPNVLHAFLAMPDSFFNLTYEPMSMPGRNEADRQQLPVESVVRSNAVTQ